MEIFNRSSFSIKRRVLTTFCLGLSLLFTCTAAWKESESDSWMCPGQELKSDTCRHKNSVLKIKSVTVFSAVNASAIEELDGNCRPSSSTIQCQRKISSRADSGLSTEYQYFYDWIVSKCEGRNVCDVGVIPQWFELIGQTDLGAVIDVDDNRQIRNLCPTGGIKYVSGVLLATECRVGEASIVTTGMLPNTTQRTRPTEPSTTTPFPVAFYIYIPELGSREKVILGVVVGLAATILAVLLIILYCWDRWRRHKRLGELLRMLGRPKEKDDELDELKIYGTPEAWRDESNHEEALAEYSGVKPDEFLTIDKQAMEKYGLVYYDQSTTFSKTLSRQNTASTLNKDGASSCGPSHDSNSTYCDTVNYNSADNIELERRMAADLYRQESDSSFYSLQRF